MAKETQRPCFQRARRPGSEAATTIPTSSAKAVIRERIAPPSASPKNANVFSSGVSKARAASHRAKHQKAREGPSGLALPNASDIAGIKENARAATAPARRSPSAIWVAQAAIASVATTPHTTKPKRTAPGLAPKNAKRAIVQATIGGWSV